MVIVHLDQIMNMHMRKENYNLHKLLKSIPIEINIHSILSNHIMILEAILFLLMMIVTYKEMIIICIVIKNTTMVIKIFMITLNLN